MLDECDAATRRMRSVRGAENGLIAAHPVIKPDFAR